MLEWVQREGKFENDEQRKRLAAVFQRAQDSLNNRLSV
jgi:hypothetical protein